MHEKRCRDYLCVGGGRGGEGGAVCNLNLCVCVCVCVCDHTCMNAYSCASECQWIKM